MHGWPKDMIEANVLDLIVLQMDCYNCLSTVRIAATLHAVCIRKDVLTVLAAATCMTCDKSTAVGILQAACYGLVLPKASLPVCQQSL